MIYLASPYTESPNTNYELAAKLTAELLIQGHTVYSPIAHCHHLAVKYDMPKSFDFWQTYNFAMLSKASELWVAIFPGWARSRGVMAEIRHARLCSIPVSLIDVDHQKFDYSTLYHTPFI